MVALVLVCGLSPARAQFTENEARGFSPEKLYDFGDVDAINTFNGNLTVTIPIGGQYPVSTTFSYGLTAVYNAQVWDFDEEEDMGEIFDFPVASELWNAGLGWVVGFGAPVRTRGIGCASADQQ